MPLVEPKFSVAAPFPISIDFSSPEFRANPCTRGDILALQVSSVDRIQFVNCVIPNFLICNQVKTGTDNKSTDSLIWFWALHPNASRTLLHLQLGVSDITAERFEFGGPSEDYARSMFVPEASLILDKSGDIDNPNESHDKNTASAY